MPLIDDTGLDAHNLSKSTYGYSAAKMDDLGATEYTLVTIAVDTSTSITDFKGLLEKCLQEIAKACKYSPRADNLMIRIVWFNSTMGEMHGFKLLQNIQPDDYIGSLNVGGMTALFDAANNSIEATSDYSAKLMEQDFMSNAIVFVLTDGCDNVSIKGADAVKQAMENAIRSESLESLVSLLIGVGVDDSHVRDHALPEFKDKGGFTQYIDAGDANAKTLAKLAEFVSKSISAQSQALGTGGPSQQLTSQSLKI